MRRVFFLAYGDRNDGGAGRSRRQEDAELGAAARTARTVRRPRQARAFAVGDQDPAQRAAAAPRRRAAHRLDAERPDGAGYELAVAVLADHDAEPRPPPEARHQHELFVPEGDDQALAGAPALVESAVVEQLLARRPAQHEEDERDQPRAERQQPLQEDTPSFRHRLVQQPFTGGRGIGLLELEVVELPVLGAEREQLLVRPLLDDLPPHHDDDAVGAPDGRESVRDDQGRAVHHEPFDRLLDEAFRLGIERRGRFVEDEDGRVLQEGARDRESLALASRERHAELSDRRVVALRQRDDEFVGIGGLGRGHDVVHRLARVAVGDIGAHGVVEEEGELGDDRDLRPQRAQRVVADVDAVDGDAAFTDVVEARNQVGDRALAAAAHADEGHHLAGIDREVDVLEHRLDAVAEADVLEDETSAHRRQRTGAGPIDDLGSGIEQLEDALGPRHPLLNRRVGFRETLERLVEEEHRRQEGEEGALAAPAGDDAVAAVPDDAADREGREHFERRRRERLDHARLHVEAIEPSVLGLEALALVLLHPEGLDDPVALHRLLEERGEEPERALAALAEATEALRQPDDRQHRRREDQERDQRQGRILVESDGHQGQERGGVAHHRRYGVGEGRAYEGDVVAHPRQDVAGRRAVEEREREALDVLIQLVAEVADDALADEVHEVVLGEARDAAKQEDDDDRDREELQGSDLAGGEDVVEHALHEQRQQARRGAEEEHRQYRPGEPRPHVRAQVAQEAEVGGAGAAGDRLGVGARRAHASISAAIAAARSAAPPPPRAGRISARARCVAAA